MLNGGGETLILGKIVGKSTTTHFEFQVSAPVEKFDFVQILQDDHYILCQIIELVRDSEKTIAECSILGFRGSDGKAKPLRTAPQPGIEVLKAEDKFIQQIVQLDAAAAGAYIGNLDGKDIPIRIDLHQLLTKHVAVLAKSGAGKSYTVGVLLEEILEHKIPLLVIDPHGEYGTLRQPNDNLQDTAALIRFGLKPKGFAHVQEYGDINIHPNAKPLRLNAQMENEQLVELLPAKLNQNQIGMLYSALQHLRSPDFESLIAELELSDAQSKWGVISMIDGLRKLELFSTAFTPYNELINSGACSIINLKGTAPEIQEIIVAKLLSDLFAERKRGTIPPFFAVIEESHTFMPERSFGEAKSSRVLRTIASEGRKFGMGLCVVSQRPARIDKSVLSQCSTQIILKITNPGDVKAIAGSVEGLTLQSEAELPNLPIGTALITGVVDMPLVVNVRPRMTKHGGQAVDMGVEETPETDVRTELAEHEDAGLMPLIRPQLSPKDIQLMEAKPVQIETFLIPAVLYTCEHRGQEFQVLIELTKGRIITNIDDGANVPIPPVNQPDFHLAQHAFYGKIQYGKVEFDKQLPRAARADMIANRIEQMAKIKNQQECHIVWYIGK